ncbi:hypothetical protein [Agrobacterium rosae]|uniref:hypothetical protein n=1 Tax=Agrobacterium rosae TaxID=1972867 RepID=UPI003B9EEF0C
MPQPVADTRTDAALPDRWTFTGEGGREADISMPILQRFHYPGDVAFCAKAGELLQAMAADGSTLDFCGKPETLPSLERAEKLAKAASQLPLLVMTDDETEKQSGDEEAAAMGLAALRDALETVPRNAPQAALSILDQYWIASLVKNPERYYNPVFLFKDAFTTEIVEARVALCRLVDDHDCMIKVARNAVDAVETVGRWSSDVGKLMLSIELAKIAHDRDTTGNPYFEIYYAQDLASSYGYASEIVEGDEKLTYLRRGVAELEHAEKRYKDKVDADAQQSLTGSLGTIYGRVAFISREKADVEKALLFDQTAADKKKELDGDVSWERLSNLGDSHLLRGEVFGTEDDLRQGLEIQQQAFGEGHIGQLRRRKELREHETCPEFRALCRGEGYATDKAAADRDAQKRKGLGR